MKKGIHVIFASLVAALVFATAGCEYYTNDKGTPAVPTASEGDVRIEELERTIKELKESQAQTGNTNTVAPDDSGDEGDGEDVSVPAGKKKAGESCAETAECDVTLVCGETTHQCELNAALVGIGVKLAQSQDGPDSTPPSITGVNPNNGQAIKPAETVRIYFSEAMDIESVKKSIVIMPTNQGLPVPVDLAVTQGSTFPKSVLYVVKPQSGSWKPGAYLATVASGDKGPKDLAGNAIEEAKAFAFNVSEEAVAETGKSPTFGLEKDSNFQSIDSDLAANVKVICPGDHPVLSALMVEEGIGLRIKGFGCNTLQRVMTHENEPTHWIGSGSGWTTLKLAGVPIGFKRRNYGITHSFYPEEGGSPESVPQGDHFGDLRLVGFSVSDTYEIKKPMVESSPAFAHCNHSVGPDESFSCDEVSGTTGWSTCLSGYVMTGLRARETSIGIAEMAPNCMKIVKK